MFDNELIKYWPKLKRLAKAAGANAGFLFNTKIPLIVKGDEAKLDTFIKDIEIWNAYNPGILRELLIFLNANWQDQIFALAHEIIKAHKAYYANIFQSFCSMPKKYSADILNTFMYDQNDRPGLEDPCI